MPSGSRGEPSHGGSRRQSNALLNNLKSVKPIVFSEGASDKIEVTFERINHNHLPYAVLSCKSGNKMTSCSQGQIKNGSCHSVASVTSETKRKSGRCLRNCSYTVYNYSYPPTMISCQ